MNKDNLTYQKNQSSRSQKILSTPKSCKILFQKFLFPVRSNKKPTVEKDVETWKHTEKDKKILVRSVEKLICGIDCGQAGLCVIDIDIYKKAFKENKKAQAILVWCLKNCLFRYQTPSGGWHFWLKGSVKTQNELFGCIDIKSVGGYVVVWDTPYQLINYDDYDDFYSNLPSTDLIPKNLLTEHKQNKIIQFGEGKNNKAIAQVTGYCANKNNIDIDARALATMINANKHRANWDAYGCAKDFLNTRYNKFYKPIIINDKDQQQKEIQTLINWGVAKVEYKRPKEFLPGIIPNAFSIWMSDTGLGKTTTIINIFTINWLTNTLPGTKITGNGKPFLYHGPENYIGLIQKRVKDAGGNLNTIEYFIDNRNRPMDVKKRLLNEGIINAIQSKQHGGIVIDRLYETLDDINKDTAKYLDPIREASMEYEVPVIGMCSQKKQKQHQTIIDQVKGDSNIAQTARAVVYLHEGKQLKQRVLVVPKNNLTGDLSKGFLTSMDTDDSPIHFEPIHGHYKSLLEQYAMGFAGMNTIPKKSDRAELIDLIKDRFEELGGDWKWSMNDFKVFLNSNTQKEWNKVGRTRLLKACGLMCNIPKNGTNYFLVKR